MTVTIRDDWVCQRCGSRRYKRVGSKQYGRCMDCQNRRNTEYLARQRLTVLNAYGGKCGCCGETNPAFLTIDHVDGGGRQHRLSVRGPFYRWLIKHGFPDGFQVLCANCNMAKERTGGCPHQAVAA